jgi:hypothetical protein
VAFASPARCIPEGHKALRGTGSEFCTHWQALCLALSPLGFAGVFPTPADVVSHIGRRGQLVQSQYRAPTVRARQRPFSRLRCAERVLYVCSPNQLALTCAPRPSARLARHAHHYLAIFDKSNALALYHTKRLASPGQRIMLYAKECSGMHSLRIGWSAAPGNGPD